MAHNHPPDTDDPPSFFWLQVVEPLEGWVLDTEIGGSVSKGRVRVGLG